MRTWMLSDVGISRMPDPNEDMYFVEKSEQGVLLAAVCDGMGGANAGEIASRMAASAFKQTFFDTFTKWSKVHVKKCLAAATTAANKAVFDAAMADEALNGMGTTVVAAAVNSDGNAVLANVGDSRAYHLTEYGISQITTDHSLVTELLIRGEISRGEAYRHPNRNLITRAIGVDPEVKCDTFFCSAKQGDFILLCSDGLTDQVSEPEIYFEVYESGRPEDACRNLIDVANSRGGKDNVTIVLIEV